MTDNQILDLEYLQAQNWDYSITSKMLKAISQNPREKSQLQQQRRKGERRVMFLLMTSANQTSLL